MRRVLPWMFGLLTIVGAQAQTPDMEQQMKMRALLIQALQAGGAPPGMQRPAPAATVAPVSEADIAKKMDPLRHPGEFYAVEQRKDGFIVNGSPYVDPEGRITRYAVDSWTGDAAYMAEISPGQGKLKWVHLSTPGEPVEFGVVSRTTAGWSVSTATGKSINGELLVLIPTGVLVGRATAVFRYEPGKGVRSTALPQGYFLAPIQRGAVGATDTVLLERTDATSSKDPLADLSKSVGRLFGGVANDYALFNMTTAAVIPLNIDASGKNTHRFSDCKRKNAVVCPYRLNFDQVYRLKFDQA